MRRGGGIELGFSPPVSPAAHPAFRHAPRPDDKHRDRAAQDRQVDSKEEKTKGQHPDPEDRQERDQPADDQDQGQRKADRKPAVAAQGGHRTAQDREQPLQGVELSLKPAFPVSLSGCHAEKMALGGQGCKAAPPR